jgi:hypothetical protein
MTADSPGLFRVSNSLVVGCFTAQLISETPRLLRPSSLRYKTVNLISRPLLFSRLNRSGFVFASWARNLCIASGSLEVER